MSTLSERPPQRAVELMREFLSKRATLLTIVPHPKKTKVQIPKGFEVLKAFAQSQPDWPLPHSITGPEWVTGTGFGPEFNTQRR